MTVLLFGGRASPFRSHFANYIDIRDVTYHCDRYIAWCTLSVRLVYCNNNIITILCIMNYDNVIVFRIRRRRREFGQKTQLGISNTYYIARRRHYFLWSSQIEFRHIFAVSYILLHHHSLLYQLTRPLPELVWPTVVLSNFYPITIVLIYIISRSSRKQKCLIPYDETSIHIL